MRKYAIIFLLFFTGLFWLPQLSEAQPLRAHTDKDSLRAGELIELYLVFDRPGNFNRIIFPDSTAFSDPFEFRSRNRGLSRAGSDSLRITLQFFGSEDTAIEELTAYALSNSDTTAFPIPEIPVYFKSSLTTDSEMRPLKPIFAFAASLLPWILLALAILLAGGLGWYGWKRYKNRPDPPPPPKPVEIPPFYNPVHVLEKGIGELERDLQAGKTDASTFYVRAGDLIREYYENTHHFPALEQTTREVVDSMRKSGVSGRLIQSVKALLQEADMVKFAKFTPGTEEMNLVIIKLKQFADEASGADNMIIVNMKMEYNRRVAKMQQVQQTVEAQS